MINMLNEKIYIFLWFWFLFVSLYTVANLVFFLLSHMVACSRSKKIKRFLKIGAYQRYLQMKNVDQQGIGRKNETVDGKRSTLVNDGIRRFDADSIDSKILNKFIECFLGADGVLLIKFVSNQCGEILASALVYRLFNKFLQVELERRFPGRGNVQELAIVQENSSPSIDRPPTISNLSRLFENDRKKFNAVGFVEMNSLLDPSLNIS
uniref:Innexin n=1 Tax=Romanomermis culicivorax TaxID=13658 RepID=A0A915KBH3_ROMCU